MSMGTDDDKPRGQGGKDKPPKSPKFGGKGAKISPLNPPSLGDFEFEFYSPQNWGRGQILPSPYFSGRVDFPYFIQIVLPKLEEAIK